MNGSTRSAKGALTTLATWILVLVFFFPVLWMFLNGFKPESLASSVNPTFFTRRIDRA